MLLEAQRIEQRTLFDIEMIEEMGYCQGIENYSRFLDGRSPGDPPATLLSYLPDDALMFIDESHVSVSQVGGMYRGDRSRKETLVNFGFRLPSALDNRPLMFEEFTERQPATVYVSATPADYEMEKPRVSCRTGHPSDRPGRPTDRSPTGNRTGRQPDRRDTHHHRKRVQSSRHHFDQAYGRRPDELSPGT